MKARVKSTGEIISVKEFNRGFDYNGRQFINYEDTKNHKTYADSQLDFDNTDNSPDDYWTRLEHQYAGMAMQGLMSILPEIGGIDGRSRQDEAIDIATSFAHALVEKMKEKEVKKWQK